MTGRELECKGGQVLMREAVVKLFLKSRSAELARLEAETKLTLRKTRTSWHATGNALSVSSGHGVLSTPLPGCSGPSDRDASSRKLWDSVMTRTQPLYVTEKGKNDPAWQCCGQCHGAPTGCT